MILLVIVFLALFAFFLGLVLFAAAGGFDTPETESETRRLMEEFGNALYSQRYGR